MHAYVFCSYQDRGNRTSDGAKLFLFHVSRLVYSANTLFNLLMSEEGLEGKEFSPIAHLPLSLRRYLKRKWLLVGGRSMRKNAVEFLRQHCCCPSESKAGPG